MKVKVNIKLSGRDVLLMHKNARDEFRDHIYTFMCYYDCSRTQEEILGISTEELMKDMWYLNASPGSEAAITYIDDELLHGMLYTIEHCGGEEIELVNLFHEYVQTRMDSGEWGNV